MTNSPLLIIYSPFPDAAGALNAARALLEDKLIACANILEGGTSLYWAEDDKLTETREMVLLAKTTPALQAAATEMLAHHHPYKTPAILSWEAAANAPYLQWLTAHVKTD